MIYLIDDKKIRQIDFGWNNVKFSKFSDYIKPLYTIQDVIDVGDQLYDNDNIILYHESFLDLTNERTKALNQRNKLKEKTESIKEFYVAFFSGSQSSRSLDENTAYLPVDILYQNLEILIEQYKKGNGHLKYLLFGENYRIEEILNELLIDANRKIENNPATINGKNLFIRPNLRYIQNAIVDATVGILFIDVSDEKLSEKVVEWLMKTEYDNIFIPLCFGQTLSDFNGLRLASHIRCSAGPNQLKRIFIYSFVGLEYLIKNEYFNVLKTKNVELVNYSKNAMYKAAIKEYDPLLNEELIYEISKLQLNIPKNYDDHHSIANEWGIHQWAKTIRCDQSEELINVFKNIESNLYFKYLRTIHPINDLNKINSDKLKLNYVGKPKILLIDDEAEKGWYEIFAYILGDINNLSIDYIGEDFKNCTSEAIINNSINKIKSDEIDIVLLDFRLNTNDFETNNSEEITSVRLLKEIKHLNAGIQVIGFSATNKIWNLQAMEHAGADGFIIKESPENNINPDFTFKSIMDFNATVQKCLNKVFLKEFYKRLDILKEELIPRKNIKSQSPLPKEFVDESIKWFELSCDVLKKEISPSMITASFLFMFSVLENLTNRIIDINNPIEVDNKKGKRRFIFEFRKDHQKLKYYEEDESNGKYYKRTEENLVSTNRYISWPQKILNTLDFIANGLIDEVEINSLIKTRNDLIHANSTTGDKFRLELDQLIKLNTIIYNGLIKVI